MAIEQEVPAHVNYVTTFCVRAFGWCALAVLAVFLINNYLVVTQSWPGISPIFGTKATGPLSWIQLSAYLSGLGIAIAFVHFSDTRTLRSDSVSISNFNTFVIRACFWAVLLIGLFDMLVSFLRVEGLLSSVVGSELTKQLARPQFRGAYLHVPLIGLGLVVAVFTRTLGFI